MRIISGKARGTKLYALAGNNTRPTLDRVKESLFNIIQDRIVDSVFLDLFAGSGSIGLEAISRGAQKAILCDSSKEAINIIRKNVCKTHFENKIEIYNLDFQDLLKTKIENEIDIAYIDPPYEKDFAINAINILLYKKLLHENSIVIVETDRHELIEQLYSLEIEILDIRKYGRANLIFIKKK